MAHTRLLRLSKNLPIKLEKRGRKFENLLILDFEATCIKNEIIKPQEIIEIPCLALSTSDWEVKDVFHKYVKPKFHPVLSSFCTDLTGIMQDTVDKESYFPEVYNEFLDWLKDGKYFDSSGKSAFVTCGDWDLRIMLPNQCQLYNLEIPECFNQWINLKTAFYSITKRYPKSLPHMLSHLRLNFQGKIHSGIDDSHNMVRVMQELTKAPWVDFDITSKIPNQKEKKVKIQGS